MFRLGIICCFLPQRCSTLTALLWFRPQSLLHIPQHPNIIPLYDAFLEPSTKELHFVFECMEGNLYQLTKSRKGRPLAGGLVADIFQQIISGLHHIHEHGYFHRDMKPENLLITTTGLDDYPASHPHAKPGTPPERDVTVIVKLADFGLARETASRPPYTEYVSTRWYRAPEVLLRSRDYSNPVDMWALGTILAELVNLKPMFPGESEVDQVLQICDVLGNPSAEYGKDSRGRSRGGGAWDRGIKMAASVGFDWPKVSIAAAAANADSFALTHRPMLQMCPTADSANQVHKSLQFTRANRTHRLHSGSSALRSGGSCHDCRLSETSLLLSCCSAPAAHQEPPACCQRTETSGKRTAVFIDCGSHGCTTSTAPFPLEYAGGSQTSIRGRPKPTFGAIRSLSSTYPLLSATS